MSIGLQETQTDALLHSQESQSSFCVGGWLGKYSELKKHIGLTDKFLRK